MTSIPEEILRDPSGYSMDWWALSLMRKRAGKPVPTPELVVAPRSRDEVASCLLYASENGLWVVPRGGGSGVCGGTTASADCMVIDLTELNGIEVDPESMTVTAGAGVFGPDLEKALAGHGLTTGHVPQSHEISTVGGWVSTKATGQFSTLYGGIEGILLGLEAVLADGRVVSSKISPRSAAGPDWWRLFLGAEGQFGIVTSATLSCTPLPSKASWLVMKMDSMDQGIGLLRRMMGSMLVPSVARLYDPTDAALNFGSAGYSDPRPLAILRFEGEPEVVEAQLTSMLRISKHEGAVLAEESLAEHWWSHRFRAALSYARIMSDEGPLGPHGVAETIEVAATWPKLPELYRGVMEALGGACDVATAHVSHLYKSGANIYFTFLISSAQSQEEAEERYLTAWDRTMSACLAGGGTISHHHGIGIVRREWMEQELGSGLEVLKSLKAAFDPTGMLNPGKLLPD